MKRAIVLAVVLMCAPLCLARTGHVPADFQTIQDGIDNLTTGDTVLVAPGKYTGRISFRGKGIMVTSSNGPEVTFLESTWPTMVSFVDGETSWAKLSGFTLRNAEGNQLVRITNGSAPVIQRNIFTSLTASEAIIYCEEAYPRIVGNLFCDNVTAYGGSCIEVFGGEVNIVNNTLDRNTSGIYSGYGETSAKNNVVTNSIEYGISGSYSESSYNDVWNNNRDYEGGAICGIGSISQDPQFWDRDNRDFRLLMTSPCIDAGDPDDTYDDPDGTRNDMGAYPLMLAYPTAADIGFGAAQRGISVSTLVPTIHWTFLDRASFVQVAYELEVGTDNEWTVAEMSSAGIVITGEDSVTYMGTPLSDDTMYYLRLRLFNGSNWGPWSAGQFFVHLGQVIHVPADQPTIQAGIRVAMDGDTILISEGRYYQRVNFIGKRITVGSEFLIDGDTTHIAYTIIDGSSTGYPDTDTGSVVRFVNGEDTSSILCGLSIVNGRGTVSWGGIVTAGAGILCRGSSALIANCWISANWAIAGGGIFTDGAGGTVVRSSLFKGNFSDFGGAIQGGPLRLEKCVFAGNGAKTGGAVYGGPLVAIECYFDSNYACDYGSAIGLGRDTAVLDRCLVRNGMITCPEGGGAVYGSPYEITNCTFDANYGTVASAIVSNGVVRIANSILANGRGAAPVVAGLWGGTPTVSISCTDIHGNQGGNWVGVSATQANVNGNFSSNPLFCDTAAGDFHLQSNSPCAPANNTCGVLIGAMPVACAWGCGDIDGSGGVNVTDAVRLIYYLFVNGSEPLDLSGGDINQDGRFNIADVVYLINYIFVGGPPPCAEGK